ncbi:uncharacterized protein LOC125372521 [Haliotis rufescens]|uniref:uncharacterized protein LOC125372521 n=1 Tax=Haliotis rufescens TaxID=6454 RepID=UPI00201E8BBF|nr:uncharacterized protein LOC125372521 [Haliotis rufescens]
MHRLAVPVGALAVILGCWYVGGALMTCTSFDDCYGMVCGREMSVMCSDFNTCVCKVNHTYVPATCTADHECHNLDCFPDHPHRKSCVNGTCACNSHLHHQHPNVQGAL